MHAPVLVSAGLPARMNRPPVSNRSGIRSFKIGWKRRRVHTLDLRGLIRLSRPSRERPGIERGEALIALLARQVLPTPATLYSRSQGVLKASNLGNRRTKLP